jgi:hypothetical protein
MIRYKVIPAADSMPEQVRTVEHLDWGNDVDADRRGLMHELQRQVGGYVEPFQNPHLKQLGLVFLIDEDGLNRARRLNKRASFISLHPRLVGDIVVVCGALYCWSDYRYTEDHDLPYDRLATDYVGKLNAPSIWGQGFVDRTKK